MTELKASRQTLPPWKEKSGSWKNETGDWHLTEPGEL